MANVMRKEARSSGISYQELIRGDVVPPPRTLTLENPFKSGITTVPVSRYTTQAFHDLEMKKLWPKVWQMACREEEIPEVGDYVVYDIGSYSIVVVRMAQRLAFSLGRRGIRINTVSPGLADTAMGRQEEEVRTAVIPKMQRLLPFPRMARPEEVAAAVAFLVGGDADFVTGIDLLVDGGCVATLGSGWGMRGTGRSDGGA